MKVAVVGASIAGLSAAIAFHRLGATVRVFEAFPVGFEKRGAAFGFVDVSLWEELRGAQMLRDGRQASLDQGAFFYGDLWNFLYTGLPEDCVEFNHAVHDLGNDNDHPTIDGNVYDVAIVADGGCSTLRHHVVGARQPEYAGYVIWRGRVDASELPGYNDFGIFKSGIYDIIVLRVPKSDGGMFIMGAIFVATPESEVTPPTAGRNVQTSALAKAEVPNWFVAWFKQTFGHLNGELGRFFEAAATKGKITPSAQYEFVADRIVAGRVALVGDAAHQATPRTGAGAHTAVLDAVGLWEAFAAARPGDIDAALAEYDREAALRAKELYRRSRAVSRQFLPLGGKAMTKSPASVLTL